MKLQSKSKRQLLLLQDVDGLGRSGDVVSAKPGYVRNFLLPQKKAVIADKHTLLLQADLKEKRAQRAIVDKKEAEGFALKLAECTLVSKVQVNPDGKMYGSVAAVEIAKLLQERGFDLKPQNILLTYPIKTLGRHIISLKLKEGVTAKVNLDIEQEGVVNVFEEKKEEKA